MSHNQSVQDALQALVQADRRVDELDDAVSAAPTAEELVVRQRRYRMAQEEAAEATLRALAHAKTEVQQRVVAALPRELSEGLAPFASGREALPSEMLMQAGGPEVFAAAAGSVAGELDDVAFRSALENLQELARRDPTWGGSATEDLLAFGRDFQAARKGFDQGVRELLVGPEADVIRGSFRDPRLQAVTGLDPSLATEAEIGTVLRNAEEAMSAGRAPTVEEWVALDMLKAQQKLRDRLRKLQQRNTDPPDGLASR